MKRNDSKAYLLITVFCTAFILFSALFVVLPNEEEAQIYDDVIRLHVIAASDGEFDTAVKILVKDAVLEEISKIYEERPVSGDTAVERCENADSLLCENVGRIEAAASECARGFSISDVSVSLTSDRFPEKTYGDITLPAGYYRSVTVKIGEAQGHNWWCVVYPGICLSPSSPAVVLKNTGFTNDQIGILQGGKGYVVKFKLLEIINGLFGR